MDFYEEWDDWISSSRGSDTAEKASRLEIFMQLRNDEMSYVRITSFESDYSDT